MRNRDSIREKAALTVAANVVAERRQEWTRLRFVATSILSAPVAALGVVLPELAVPLWCWTWGTTVEKLHDELERETTDLAWREGWRV